jgi:hypothetical protein
MKLLKKIVYGYAEWYYRHPVLNGHINAILAAITTLMMISLILNKEYVGISIFIWIWGLSIVSLFEKHQ